MPKFTIFLSILTLTLMSSLFTGLAQAGEIIYKWKDSSGQIKYTQSKPPSGIAYTIIRDRSAKDVLAKEIYKKPEQAASKANNESSNQAGFSSKEEIRRKNCEISKSNLNALENGDKVKVVENGEERFLTDEERSERLTTVKENIERFCDS